MSPVGTVQTVARDAPESSPNAGQIRVPGDPDHALSCSAEISRGSWPPWRVDAVRLGNTFGFDEVRAESLILFVGSGSLRAQIHVLSFLVDRGLVIILSAFVLL